MALRLNLSIEVHQYQRVHSVDRPTSLKSKESCALSVTWRRLERKDPDYDSIYNFLFSFPLLLYHPYSEKKIQYKRDNRGYMYIKSRNFFFRAHGNEKTTGRAGPEMVFPTISSSFLLFGFRLAALFKAQVLAFVIISSSFFSVSSYQSCPRAKLVSLVR